MSPAPLIKGSSCFGHCKAFLEELAQTEGLKMSEYRILNSTSKAMIEHRPTGARVRCTGSDPRRSMGAAPFLVVADELSSWPAVHHSRHAERAAHVSRQT